MGNKYVIIGCGGHAKSILDVILFNEPAADVVFLDKNAKENEKILNYPVVKDYNIKEEKVIIGIGDNVKRRNLSEKYYNNLTSVISKTAYIGKDVKIGKGVFIAHNAYVGIFSEIGDFSVVNTGAIVEHECKLEKCVFIGPNSTICGKANVGANTFIGADTTILPRINICSDVTIGAKSLVAKEIQSGGGGLVSRDTLQTKDFWTGEELIKMGFKHVGKNVKIFKKATIVKPENIYIGDYSQIDDFVHIIASQPIYIGKRVHISTQCVISGGGSCTIEDYAGLAAGCKIITGSDDFLGNAMTNPCVPEEYRKVNRSFVTIKKHSILGTNSIVLPGITIEEGTASTVGTVFYKNSEPWSIYKGCPAIKAGRRKFKKILELEKELKKNYD